MKWINKSWIYLLLILMFGTRCHENEQPFVETSEATLVQPYGATLNGYVNPNNFPTTVTFEYGVTTDYGLSVTATPTPLNGGSTTKVSTKIERLTLHETWHFRIIAESEHGISTGEDLTFFTDWFHGGTLAYLYQPGDPGYDPTIQHGLIIGPPLGIRDDHFNQLLAPWIPLNLSPIEIGALSTTIGAGKTNTERIVSHYGTGIYAAKFCSDLIYNGYDDWFLPSLDELKVSGEHHLCNTCNNSFWSSSEYSITAAWGMSYPRTNIFGANFADQKTRAEGVLAFRYF